LIVFWGDQEEVSSSSIPPRSSSSRSSSSVFVAISSSSSENEPSSSAEEVPSSSSEEPSSSSSRGPRSSSSKTDSNGYTYEDYPHIEEGAKGVKRASTTRYWDGCRPACSYIGNIGTSSNPWVIGRACSKNGVGEIPLLFLNSRSNNDGTYYTDTPCHKEADKGWTQSQTYRDWVSTNPDFPEGSHAYTCFDMAPYAVNDTLAYAFVATNELACGKCFQLQFNNSWDYDSKPRVTHRALKGKTLIVMSNNTGAEKDGFDIMIPGGGEGMYNCIGAQLGLPEGVPVAPHIYGGLLAECSYNEATEFDKLSDRFSLEEWQQCLETRCHRAFDGKPKQLLDGCLWHVNWFMAADNPVADYVEVPCPKYLVDKYNSTATTKLPDCYTSNPRTCSIDGM